MGCGVSAAQGKSEKLSGPAPNNKLEEPRVARRSNNNGSRASDEPRKLNGKEKYILENGGLVCEMEDRRRTGMPQCYVIVYGSHAMLGFTVLPVTSVSTSSYAGDYFYNKELSNDALRESKEQQRVTHTWAAFFKSISTEITKTRVKLHTNASSPNALPSEVRIEFSITSSKDPKAAQVYSVLLTQKSRHVAGGAQISAVFAPLFQYLQHRKSEHENTSSHLESELILKAAALLTNKHSIERIMPELRTAREVAAALTKSCAESQSKIATLERHLRRLRTPEGKDRHFLNRIYETGGAISFQHVSYAEEHYPKEVQPKEGILDLIRSKLPPSNDTCAMTTLFTRPVSPLGNVPEEVYTIFTRLDEWEFDVFALDAVTDNSSLFHVTFALLYRWNLMQTFSLEEKTVRRFLINVQAGYHKNPYHNATHAADVTQIMSFLLGPGGLHRATNLQMEDILAAILAASIHDYDHPGFNNNFHTRTGAYLSTLYNDRSILENHHLACIFEMMRLPEYDVLASLSAEKRKEVRDTMIEMVLSTDMGNHAKIFSQFRKRLSENADWPQRMEDRRLVLSMAIKMADISNCGRPNKLYLQWAGNLAEEFYNQGDVEARLNFPISPFMDRRKGSTDFKKGQISFMNYIVLPMFDAIVEFLPNLEFVLSYCASNKEYWQGKEN